VVWGVASAAFGALLALAILTFVYQEETKDWFHDRLCDMQGPESRYNEGC
jgi:hypothetical protein